MTDQRTRIGDDEYAVLLQYDPGGGYEWSSAMLLRRIRDGQLFYLGESGCSCNGPLVDTMTSDLEPVATWQEAVEYAKASAPGYFTADEVATFAEQLAELRPASSRQAQR